jgi:hypothetical protein
MVVAMITMRMMQPSIHEVIDVVPMGHGFVPASRAMLVRAGRLRRAMYGIDRVDCNCMLINVILVRVMQMAIMKIIDMVIMPDRCMPAVGTMHVAMIAMMLLGAGSHCLFPFSFTGNRWFSAFGCMVHGAFHKTQNVSVGKRIIDVLCLTPSFDKSHVMQRLETSRNGGQLFAFHIRQLSYAGLAAGNERFKRLMG